MRSYSVKISDESRNALALLTDGVCGVGLDPKRTSPSECYLRLVSGGYLNIYCEWHDLEWKFEVFSIEAQSTVDCPFPVTPLEKWQQPCKVLVLCTEEWIEGMDFDASETNLLGNNPVCQGAGKPGSAPSNAIARCQVELGISIENSARERFTIAASTYPLGLYISGYTPADELREQSIVRVPL